MARLPLLCRAVAVACLTGTSAAAQTLTPAPLVPVRQIAADATRRDLRGTVLDDEGKPLPGAVISAVGATSAFAVSERDGTFTLRNLAPGSYLVRAHLKGYVPTRTRTIQISEAVTTAPVISLSRRPQPTDEPQVLEAGVGPSATSGETDAEDVQDAGEIAWRLRHLKRSVLKDAEFGDFEERDSFIDDPLDGVGRALEVSARLASGWFSDLSLNGQINLLTRTSFDHPQDLLSLRTAPPAGITYVSLSAPTVGGDWSMRGAMSQGDLSSWILSGGYVRRAPSAAHQYEAGVSYSAQRYLGGNVDTLTAVNDGARSVGAVHASDRWTVVPAVSLTYGAKYARYDYLDRRGLFSPSLAVSITPVAGGSLRINASASRQEVAPGAEEFLPPSSGLWLPPERTFSSISPHRALSPERVDRFEVSAERQWVGDLMIGLRAYRETVDDQIVTLFGGVPMPTSTSMGHYYVASGGDFDAMGWGVQVSRAVVDGLRASIEYTQTDADWSGVSLDRGWLRRVAASALRTETERVHDLTASFESDVPATATRFIVIYKLNSAFATSEDVPEAKPGLRFDVQVNQALPFMNFASAQWELLVAVRNMFREDFREGSLYDELLVVRPPKRVVCGLTLRF